MKLVEARQAMNHQMDILDVRREKLRKALKEQEKTGSPNFDRVEITKELEKLDQAYEEAFNERERLNALHMVVHNAETSRQQAEMEAKANEDRLKCLEIFRRIANGDKVPPADEQKLMEYDGKMYMAAKSMAVLHMDEKSEKYDSLWEDEEEKKDYPDAQELADNTEVAVCGPKMPELSAAEAELG